MCALNSTFGRHMNIVSSALRATNLISPLVFLLASISGCTVVSENNKVDRQERLVSMEVARRNCEDPRLPKHRSCVEELLPYKTKLGITNASLISIHVDWERNIDVFIPIHRHFMISPQGELIEFSNAQTDMRRQLDGMFSKAVLPGRFNMMKGVRALTPMPKFYSVEFEETTNGICLKYEALYPFAGTLRHCASGELINELRYADGVITFETAERRSLGMV